MYVPFFRCESFPYISRRADWFPCALFPFHSPCTPLVFISVPFMSLSVPLCFPFISNCFPVMSTAYFLPSFPCNSLHVPFAPQYLPHKPQFFPAFSQLGRPKTQSFSRFSAKGDRNAKSRQGESSLGPLFCGSPKTTFSGTSSNCREAIALGNLLWPAIFELHVPSALCFPFSLGSLFETVNSKKGARFPPQLLGIPRFCFCWSLKDPLLSGSLFLGAHLLGIDRTLHQLGSMKPSKYCLTIYPYTNWREADSCVSFCIFRLNVNRNLRHKFFCRVCFVYLCVGLAAPKTSSARSGGAWAAAEPRHRAASAERGAVGGRGGGLGAVGAEPRTAMGGGGGWAFLRTASNLRFAEMNMCHFPLLVSKYLSLWAVFVLFPRGLKQMEAMGYPAPKAKSCGSYEEGCGRLLSFLGRPLSTSMIVGGRVTNWT